MVSAATTNLFFSEHFMGIVRAPPFVKFGSWSASIRRIRRCSAENDKCGTSAVSAQFDNGYIAQCMELMRWSSVSRRAHVFGEATNGFVPRIEEISSPPSHRICCGKENWYRDEPLRRSSGSAKIG
jgi:hypothetical protein